MITLRPATLEDLELVHHWDQQPHVIASDPDSDWNWEEELAHDPPWRDQCVAELHGRPIGFVQIIDPAEEETHYWGEAAPNQRAIDIWIGEADDLNKGHGTEMMKQALERCFANGDVWQVLIDPLDSNRNAHRFYERIGFEFLEYRYFDEERCKVYRLTRERWIEMNARPRTSPEKHKGS